MNKLFKKITVLLSTLILVVSCVTFTVSAASATISFSNKSPQVNQAVTVSVTINADEAMYAAQFTVNYDPAVLRFDGGESANGGAGAVSVVSAPSGEKRKSYSLNFTAIASGSSSVQVTNAMYATDVEKPLSGATAKIVVSDAKKSANANLKALSLSTGTLSPKFSSSVKSYTATVPLTATDCKIYATAEDSAAKVEVSGSSTLKGDTKIARTITVTAPSGAQNFYTVTIVKGADSTASSLPSESTPSVGTTNIDNVEYAIAADISAVKIPEGFKAVTVDYNGTTVAAAQDNEAIYTIYYLKSDTQQDYTPYVLGKDTKIFEKLKYMTMGEKTFIFADFPDNFTADGCFETNVEINGFNIKCLSKNDTKYPDFCYVYCFRNEKFGLYRYDKTDDVLQREPELTLVQNDDANKPVSGGLAKRFGSLSNNAKVIVICLFGAAFIVLALLILLVIKIIKSNQKQTDEYDDMMFSGDFDSAFITDTQEDKEDKEDKTIKK